jgi:hypothetical protein
VAAGLLGGDVKPLGGLNLGNLALAFALEDQSNTLRIGSKALPLFAIGCAQACTVDVGKVVVLTGTKAGASAAAKSRKLKLATQKLTLAKGKFGVAKLKLSKKQRAKVGKAKKAQLVLTVTVRSGARKVTSKKTYRLKLARK